ncbi:hypothetical protein KAW18_10755 [candidate division WOR-3 bacterium]|nr:hypothetical protein [candidate division WOR-3 bacterium]MCK4527840.1 hypothetical protein [candidate division WOR-3 bacterium]
MEIDNVIEQDLINTTKDMSGWLKLVGIVSIIGGVLSALSIVGIIVAWLPIWQGALLVRAANGSQEVGRGEIGSLSKVLGPLKTFFIIQGVLILLGIFGWIFAIFIIGIGGLTEILGGSGIY